jgi:hypothetical protein
MKTTQKGRKISLLKRMMLSISDASQRMRTARQVKKLAIHPSFLDDFGA